MEINGAGSVSGPEPAQPSRLHSSRLQPSIPKNVQGPDQVEISEIARLKALLKEVPAVRFEKIQEIRAQIDAGTYETPEKIRLTIERLLEEI